MITTMRPLSALPAPGPASDASRSAENGSVRADFTLDAPSFAPLPLQTSQDAADDAAPDTRDDDASSQGIPNVPETVAALPVASAAPMAHQVDDPRQDRRSDWPDTLLRTEDTAFNLRAGWTEGNVTAVSGSGLARAEPAFEAAAKASGPSLPERMQDWAMGVRASAENGFQRLGDGGSTKGAPGLAARPDIEEVSGAAGIQAMPIADPAPDLRSMPLAPASARAIASIPGWIPAAEQSAVPLMADTLAALASDGRRMLSDRPENGSDIAEMPLADAPDATGLLPQSGSSKAQVSSGKPALAPPGSGRLNAPEPLPPVAPGLLSDLPQSDAWPLSIPSRHPAQMSGFPANAGQGAVKQAAGVISATSAEVAGLTGWPDNLPQSMSASQGLAFSEMLVSSFASQRTTSPFSLGRPSPLGMTIVQLAQVAPEGPVILTLRPDDLGTLTFELRQTDHGLHLHLTVDQPATLDLLRRQGDQLLNDLRQAGFAGASLTFAEGNGAGRGADEGGAGHTAAHPGGGQTETVSVNPAMASASAASLSRPMPGTLDLRL